MEPFEYDALAAREDTHWWYTGMAALSRAIIADRIRPPARILDAGCGTGGALRWLKSFGSPLGFDVSPLALRHARRGNEGCLARAEVEFLPFPDGTFDLVTSFDVLYHLRVSQDSRALAELYRVLRPDGWLCLRVPAHPWLSRGHDTHVHTRERYSRAELERRLQEAGFDVRLLSFAGAVVFLAAIVQSALDAIRDTAARPESDLRLPPPVLNSALRAALRIEAPLIRRGHQPLGLSLYAMAKRP